MKCMTVHKKNIGENTFYIRVLPAFRAACISGELTAFFGPLVASLTPLAVTASTAKKKNQNMFDTEMDTAVITNALSGALSSLSGDSLEALLRRLLIENKNVRVDVEDKEQPQLLTEDLANEIFCEDLQDMYVLAFEAIRINYGGFFGKLGDRFGDLIKQTMEKVAPSMENMESSTAGNLQI